MYVVWPNSGVFQIFFKRITLGRCWNYGNKWDIFCKIVIFGTVTKSHQVLTCSHQPATLFAVWWVIFVRRNYNYLICVVNIHRDSFSLRKHFRMKSTGYTAIHRHLQFPMSHLVSLTFQARSFSTRLLSFSCCWILALLVPYTTSGWIRNEKLQDSKDSSKSILSWFAWLAVAAGEVLWFSYQLDCRHNSFDFH